MAVGMSIDVGLILASPLRVAALALVVVVLKLAVLLLLALLFRLSREDAWIFGLSISQVGEFAFVLLGPAAASGVLEPRLAALANAVVAVSMLSTPLLFLVFERWIRRDCRRVDRPPTRSKNATRSSSPGRPLRPDRGPPAARPAAP
jgi:Kef-type K+ transport system membrane component KefB